jgi:hypothetical protein
MDTKAYYVSEASVYRLLKAHDLITSPAFIVINAADQFKDQTTAPNEQIVDGFDDSSRAREAGALLAKPGFQTGQKRRALVLADAQTLDRGKAVDGALDAEQRVDACHRLQRDRGDRRRLFAEPRVGGDVSQFEELAPRIRPTQRRSDDAWGAQRIAKPVIAVFRRGISARRLTYSR